MNLPIDVALRIGCTPFECLVGQSIAAFLYFPSKGQPLIVERNTYHDLDLNFQFINGVIELDSIVIVFLKRGFIKI